VTLLGTEQDHKSRDCIVFQEIKPFRLPKRKPNKLLDFDGISKS